MKTKIAVIKLTQRARSSALLSKSASKSGRKFLHDFFYCLSLVFFSLLLAACQGDDTSPPPPPSVDISGTWAGTWSGTNPAYGEVNGNWEAEVSQTDSGITGTGTLSGDVDCMDGDAEGSVGANNVVSGTLTRFPCQQNEWTMTALNILERSTSGIWTQLSTGAQGTFTGTQIAKPDGPRISVVNPAGGLPGTIVTITGTRFSSAATDDLLDFNAAPVTEFLAADSTKLVVRVPQGATTGPVFLTTRRGTAISPKPFNVKVTSPSATLTATISIATTPEGIAISPDGRKAYVANKGNGRVSMINTATNQVITTTLVDPAVSVPVQGIVVSPDGKRVYVAGGSKGVIVLDAATIAVVDTIPLDAGGGAQPNPQGVAMSPDGRVLYVSDNKDGGAVTVLDIASKQLVASLSMGPGTMPLGMAVSPDGTQIYIAFSGLDEIVVFDSASYNAVGIIPAGSRPVGVAMTPDGRKIYITNELGDSVSVYDTTTNQTTTKQVGTAPTGVAISPDGSRAYVTNRGSNTVSIISVTADQVVTTVPVGSGPVGIAISPDGKRAYVTNSAGNTVSELGGPRTLTITKKGTGIGTVISNPGGINCGMVCQASFDSGTVVSLTATADGSSYFSGWSSDCYGSTLTMNANKTCTATFNANSSGGGGSGGGGSGSGGGSYYYGCFIATAAYGSPDDPHVKVLGEFHRKYFTENRLGRAITKFYHAYSPPIADFISGHETVRFAVRMVLTPVVYALQYPVSALLTSLALIAGLRIIRKRRSASFAILSSREIDSSQAKE